jgi:hypothetical protein
MKYFIKEYLGKEIQRHRCLKISKIIVCNLEKTCLNKLRILSKDV